MKIEKIHFKNLASLRGEWSIDFTDPVFADAGIFALSGPVGSGKSTIFDAVCLAIYGRTARLERLNQENNEIMTRGTSECFSEAVFSNERGRFLVRWSQHRASRTGNLQSARHILSEYDPSGNGKILSSKLKETDSLVCRLTGMDFTHFSRAMILPQGQFAAFLQASSDERSPILEQITGTEIYGEISMKICELAGTHKRELEDLKRKADGIELFPEERVKELQSAIESGEKTVQSIKREYDSVTEILRTAESLNAETKNAEALAQERRKLEHPLAEAELACADAADAVKHAADERAMLAPLLLKVRELDTRLKLCRASRDAQKNEVETCRDAQRRAEKARREMEADLQDARNLLSSLRDTLAMHQADAGIGAVLGSVKLLCDQLETLKREAEAAEKRLEKLVTKQKNQEQTVSAASRKVDEQNPVVSAAETLFRQKSELLKAHLNGLSVPEFFSKKENLASLVHELEEQLARFAEADKRANELLALDRSQKQIQTELASARELLNVKLALKKSAEERIALLHEKQIAEAKIAKLESLRKELKPGAPCPLCGSTEHPYVRNLPAPEPDLLPQANADLKKLEESVSAQQTAVAQLDTLLRSGAKDLKKKEDELTELRAKLTGDRAALEEEVRISGAEFARFKVLSGMIETADRDQKSAKDKLESAREELRVRSAALETERSLLKQNSEKIEYEKRLADERESRKLNLQNSLSESLSGVSVDASVSANTLYDTLSGRFAEYENLTKQEKSASEKTARLETELQARLERLETSKSETLSQEKKLADLEAGLTALSVERCAFFGDKLPDEEEKKANDACASAQKMQKDSEKALQELRLKAASLKTSSEESRKRITAARDFLSAHGVGLPADVEAMSAALKALDEKRRQAQSAAVENRLLLERDEQERKRFAGLAGQIAVQEELCRKWKLLNDLIGSSDGKKYRSFVQSLAFETLIERANAQLEKFTDHFILSANPKNGLEFNIIDRYRGDEVRSTRNLSGGETFLVSLSLALGLSRMARDRARIDTLFLDEGFGTLDEDTLQHALEQLSSLRQNGKLIGIISHAHGIDAAVPVVLRLENNRGVSTIHGPGVTRKEE